MKEPKPPRRWNSTLRVTPKKPRVAKTSAPTSRAWINRTTTQPAKPKKALSKSNPERQAKRRKAYAVKLAAYKRSETYRIVEARAGGRCERREDATDLSGAPLKGWLQCTNSRADGLRLTHNHKTYARFGGKELPEDVELLCDHHNTLYESQHPTRNRNYR